MTDDERQIFDRLQHSAVAFARRSEFIRLFAATEASSPVDRSGFLLLSHLHAQGPQSLTALAEMFDVHPSTITRQIRTLADRDQVRTCRSADNHKVVVAEITKRGTSDYLHVKDARVRLFADLLVDWSTSDVDALGSLLERFVGVLAADEKAPRRNNKFARHSLILD